MLWSFSYFSYPATSILFIIGMYVWNECAGMYVLTWSWSLRYAFSFCWQNDNQFDLIWCGWTKGIAYVLPSIWDVDKNDVMVFGKEAVKTGCIERLQLDQPNNKWDQDNLKRCWARVERKTGLWIAMKWACCSVNSVRLKQIPFLSGPHHYIWYIES